MSKQNQMLWIGVVGVTVVLICWATVWYLATVSIYLWLSLVLLGSAMCLLAGMRRSKWFFLATGLGLLVAVGVYSGAIFGR